MIISAHLQPTTDDKRWEEDHRFAHEGLVVQLSSHSVTLDQNTPCMTAKRCTDHFYFHALWQKQANTANQFENKGLNRCICQKVQGSFTLDSFVCTRCTVYSLFYLTSVEKINCSKSPPKLLGLKNSALAWQTGNFVLHYTCYQMLLCHILYISYSYSWLYHLFSLECSFFSSILHCLSRFHEKEQWSVLVTGV